MDHNLLQLQIDLYRHLKRRVRDIFGEESSELKKYRRAHQRLAKRRVFSITIKEFTQYLKQTDLIFLGDFHTFDQNIRNFERIIREGFGKKKIGIGIEFVDSNHQDVIDLYMDDEINEYQFLEQINYSESWRFPWSHYRQIFELAKANNHQVIALNSSGGLKQRDKHAACLIADYFDKNADSKLIVLFGEYHLVADKLPLQVKKLTDNINMLTIHQNIDQLYWKLNEKSGDAVFSFSRNEFLLLTSPPWIKYESMIYWYENLSDDPEFDIHQYILENNTKTFSENADEGFVQLCHQLNQLLRLDLSRETIEDFNLLDHRKLDYIHKLITKNYDFNLQRFYRKLLKNGKSFKLQGMNSYYCSNYSANRLSFLAGVHIHSLLLKSNAGDCENILNRGKQVERFFFLLYQSLFSYFCSKLLNPYRKCDLYLDIKARQQLLQTSAKKRKNLKMALDIIDRPNELNELIAHCSLRGLHSTAKTVGNMLADWIFDHSFKESERPIEEILPMLLGQIYSPSKFCSEFEEIFTQPKFKNARKRLF